CATRPELGIGW
nr:immunoglobulin heavy chain junction region [Mus musculus]